jgi:hypothetical protein
MMSAQTHPQENDPVQTISAPQDAILETNVVLDHPSAQLDSVVLSRALVNLAAGMEQIENALYSLMIRR